MSVSIADNIMFFNEVDLLKLRLAEHYDFVDQFFIVEADTSLSLQPKPLYYLEHRSEFKEWEDKIWYQTVYASDWFTDEGTRKRTFAEVNERRQRFWFQRYHTEEILKYDYIMYFDADESISRIHFPRVIETLEKHRPETLGTHMDMFYYYMNTKLSKPWSYVRVCKPENIPGPFSRDTVEVPGIVGNHFSFLGGPEAVAEKMRSYSHCEEFKLLATDLVEIKCKMENLEDVLERPNFVDLHGTFEVLKDPYHLPRYVRENYDTYKKYMK